MRETTNTELKQVYRDSATIIIMEFNMDKMQADRKTWYMLGTIQGKLDLKELNAGNGGNLSRIYLGFQRDLTKYIPGNVLEFKDVILTTYKANRAHGLINPGPGTGAGPSMCVCVCERVG